MRLAQLRPFVGALLLGASACHRTGGAPAPGADAGAAARDPIHPETQAELPTTDGAIALGNLEAQIRAQEAALARMPADLGTKQHLVTLVAMRGQYLGRIADRERALALADEMVAAAPGAAQPYLARASARSSLHRFEAALADLAEAEKHKARPPELRSLRASIREAQGDLEGALALRRAAREARADIGTLGTEAALLGELGRYAEAEERFREAAKSYPDVSPFAVAWLFFQEGLMWERAGEPARAKAFHAEALARFPVYAQAAAHLARLVPPARGIELLTPVVAASDDPELELVLAEILRKKGDGDEAERRLSHVQVRYEELCARYPEAFAEHAGWFWLDQGKAPEKALALARQNLAVRRTAKAYELGILAATAAGKPAEACEIGAGVAKVANASEMLRRIAAEACQRR
jgi:tetratricopeptide (TPR) repeat protein